MKETKLFIWDFHGTLEHGNDAAVHEITNRVLESQGHSRRMSMEEAELLAGKRWHEYFAYLMPEIEQKDCLHLQMECISVSQNNPDIIAKHIKLTPHAEHVLETIHKSHHTQIVLSNTQPRALDHFLQAVKIEHYFPTPHRIAADSHSQIHYTKKDFLSKFMHEKEFPGGIVAIGDSPGDVSLAECHPKGVGYLFSHPSRTHREANCHFKINDLRAVLQELGIIHH